MTPSEAIHALMGVGFTEAAIAAAVNTTQPTINRVKHGGEPGYGLGRRLVQLVAEVNAKDEADND